jgi:hypothetical protein
MKMPKEVRRARQVDTPKQATRETRKDEIAMLVRWIPRRICPVYSGNLQKNHPSPKYKDLFRKMVQEEFQHVTRLQH